MAARFPASRYACAHERKHADPGQRHTARHRRGDGHGRPQFGGWKALIPKRRSPASPKTSPNSCSRTAPRSHRKAPRPGPRSSFPGTRTAALSCPSLPSSRRSTAAMSADPTPWTGCPSTSAADRAYGRHTAAPVRALGNHPHHAYRNGIRHQLTLRDVREGILSRPHRSPFFAFSHKRTLSFR